MSFNKWGSHVIVRCFSESAVSPPTPSGSESRTRARKSKQAAREQGHHHEGIWGTAAYFFSVFFFQILRLVKVSASACCVIVSVAARWLDIPAHQPVRGHLHHKRAEPPLEVWGGDRGKHRERCGGIQKHQAAAGEPSLPFIKHTAALSGQFSQTKLANAAHVDNSRGHFFCHWQIELSFENAHCNILVFIFLFKKRTVQ